MKQRIRLSILMLWSFMHFLLFAFNGFGINDKSSSYSFSLPIDMENWTREIKNVGFLNSNFFGNLQMFDYWNYDLTEFLIYVIFPVFILCLFNYIMFNQFRLLIDKSKTQMLEKQNNDKITDSIEESIKITPQQKFTNDTKAIIYLMVLIFIILVFVVIKNKNQEQKVKKVMREDDWIGWAP